MTDKATKKNDDAKPSRVFKIAARPDWELACRNGVYQGSVDDRRDGFIHLSAPHQVEGTLQKHFKGQRDLVIIVFEVNALAENLKWEVARAGDLFPHFYGGLETRLALWTRPLVLGPEDVPMFDKAWLTC